MSHPTSILFVDDDVVFCDYFQNISKPYNIELHVVHTFAEAQELIRRGFAQAYILDANLKDGSGFELAELVRKKYGEKIPIAIISGVFRNSDYFKKLKEDLKISYVVDKPISLEESRALLCELCPGQAPVEEVNDGLSKLMVKYEKMIPSIYSELEGLLKDVGEQKDKSSLNALKQVVHRIAGTAGTMGYPKVSDLCKEWDNELKDQESDLERENSFSEDWFSRQVQYLSKVKFYFQLRQDNLSTSNKNEQQLKKSVKRLPLYVISSDRDFLTGLEREKASFPYQVTTEWDPIKAQKRLKEEGFNPRVVFVEESFKGSTIKGKDLIDLVRQKNDRLPTSFGLILDESNDKKRFDAIREGIKYVLEKPISIHLLLNTIENALRYEEHPEFNVLIVDDDPIVCEFLTQALAEIGMSCKVLTEGAHLFERIKEYKPNLLLLDIYLPGQNGLELLKNLRAEVKFQDLLVVIITASNDDEMLAAAYRENVEDILHKPFSKKVIQSRIQSLAFKQSQQEQHAMGEMITGFSNEPALEAFLREKLLNAEHTRMGMFLALISIDQLHLIRDALEVEEVLAHFSTFLIEESNQWEFEAYMGQGQFAIVSEITDLHTFKMQLEEVLERAQKEIKPPLGTIPTYSFSCGLIAMPVQYKEYNEVMEMARGALKEAKGLGDENPVKIVSHLGEGQKSAQSRRVVLIDPDQDLTNILKEAFESKGLEVSTYSLGEPFLEDIFLKQSLLPPLVLMERRLPDMDGIELLRRLHRRYPVQLPVIFLSNLSSDQDVLEGLKAGALDYITKPFNLNHLMQKSVAVLLR